MKSCQQLQLMFCFREYQPTSRLNEQNKKSTSNDAEAYNICKEEQKDSKVKQKQRHGLEKFPDYLIQKKGEHSH